MKKGLYGKYKIEKVDGTPIDENAQYFVLRVDTDFHARVALRTYARSIEDENPELARDIRRMLEAGQKEFLILYEEQRKEWEKLPKGSFFNP